MGKKKTLRLPNVIRTEQDVRDFFRYLIVVDRASFHPDDDLTDYGHNDLQGRWVPLYTEAQAIARNTLMRWSWEVVGDRIYDIALQMMETYAGRGPKDWTPYDS